MNLWKNIILFALIFLITSGPSIQAQTLSGEQILERVDNNYGSDNKIMVATMVIHGRRGSREVTSKTWVKGDDRSFTEYLAPPREKGTKMLKLGDQLWMFSPSTDRTIQISGHMLRQSVMGSDLSYEDMMEDPKLQNMYNAQVISEETYMDRPCWVLELTSLKEDIAYHSRKIWVDKERYVVLKEDRFAKGGKLLKTTEVKKVEQIDDRWVPTHALFKDVLKNGEGTEFRVESMEFNAEIPEYIFTKAALRR
ncbi:MAG: outer membrane lipoprotein-sorting protein [Candidatus Aminicenantes bacterium]|nr:outer membrane lipoprotein-sorting protein [Candidatus Aminicenantes bacterium]